MKEAQVVTMLQMPNLKPLQLKHSTNDNLKTIGGNTNNQLQIHNENTLKTNSVRNTIAVSPVSPVCKVYNNKRNKNKTLRRTRRRQTAEEESLSSKMQPRDLNAAESEESKTVLNVESERNENMNRVQQHCTGCKDVVILHSDEDIEAVFDLRSRLLDLGIPELTVDIYDNIHLGKNEMESIRLVHEQYKTVLVYETSDFCKNRIKRHQADILYLNSLKSNQQVIPVWPENSFPHFTGIKGIHLGKNMPVFSEQVKGLVMAGRKQLVF